MACERRALCGAGDAGDAVMLVMLVVMTSPVATRVCIAGALAEG